MKKPVANIVKTTITSSCSNGAVLLKSSALLIGTLFISQAVQAATQHVVETGETLSGIAIRYDVSQTALIDTNGLRVTDVQIGQVLEIPDKEKRHNIYKVKSGDSLSSISRKYNISSSELARVNNLSPGTGLYIDSTLIIPANNTVTAKPTVTRTVDKTVVISDAARTSVKTTIAPAPAPATRDNRNVSRHLVKYGDSLYKIAKMYQVDVRSLAQANNMTLSDTLFFGQYITLPNANSNSSVAVASSKAAPARIPTSAPSKYVVQRGDTLMGIANKFKTNFLEIAKLTGIDYNNPLAIGQVLTLPKDAAAPASNSSY